MLKQVKYLAGSEFVTWYDILQSSKFYLILVMKIQILYQIVRGHKFKLASIYKNTFNSVI